MKIPEGWKLWPTNRLDNCDRHWFKFYKTKTLCQLNKKEKGLQFELREWNCGSHLGYDIHTSAEMKGGRWPQFTMSVECVEDIDKVVHLILAAWEVMNKE